ncbi:hypothetical protein [Yersinia massiliensis]|uniref:hypothetical protein n=1 Tax=Yersinia massiliensis TaxID=419257 RepID=UPI0011A2E30A|nr:hypothetical protein [Yersinia massiliensis]
MAAVAFQDLDNYMQAGCYILVEQLLGAENTRWVEMSDLTSETEELKILFRSKPASLQQCTCDLLHKNVAIITIISRGWEGCTANDAIYMKSGESLECFKMSIQMAIDIAVQGGNGDLCPHCEIMRSLTIKEKEIINMMKNNKSMATITRYQKNRFGSSSYYSRDSIMKKVGITNKIGIYRFVNLIAQ